MSSEGCEFTVRIHTPRNDQCFTLGEAMQPMLDDGWEAYEIEDCLVLGEKGKRVYYSRQFMVEE